MDKKQIESDVINEVEAVPVEMAKGTGFWGFVWDAVKPGLLAFWAKDKDKILAQLKTLGESAVKAIIGAIKENKEQKK